MKELLTPKLDLVFKQLFTQDTGILADLLNAVLKLSGRRSIRSVKIRNPLILPDDIIKKFIILDIRAQDRSGRQYDIEMQSRKYIFYPGRALYYLTRMYADQLESGEDYGELRPVVGIHFLDFTLFPEENDFRFCFRLRDSRHPELGLTDDFSLHIFELPKLREKKDRTGPKEKDLGEWLHFFNYAHKEGDETVRAYYTNPMIHRAFGVLETLSADDEVRLRAEMREKALKDEVSALGAERREGRKEGRKEARKHTARNLLLMGILTPEQISQATGLSIRELKKLRKTETYKD